MLDGIILSNPFDFSLKAKRVRCCAILINASTCISTRKAVAFAEATSRSPDPLLSCYVCCNDKLYRTLDRAANHRSVPVGSCSSIPDSGPRSASAGKNQKPCISTHFINVAQTTRLSF